jgi:hypothetical protein
MESVGIISATEVWPSECTQARHTLAHCDQPTTPYL